MKSFDTNIFIISISDKGLYSKLTESLANQHSCIILRSIEEEIKNNFEKIIPLLTIFKNDIKKRELNLIN